MEKRRLGQSGIEVSVVGVGCNNFGGRIHDFAATRAVVHRALDLGVTLFDTADVYGNKGKSEEFLGERSWQSGARTSCSPPNSAADDDSARPRDASRRLRSCAPSRRA